MTLSDSRSSSSLPIEQQTIEVRIFALNSHGTSDAVSLRLAKQKSPPNRLNNPVDSGNTTINDF